MITMVIVDGQLSTEYSPPNVIVADLKNISPMQADLIQQYFPQAMLDQSGLFIHVPANIQCALHLKFITTAQNDLLLQPQNYFIFDENSSINLLVEHIDIFSQRCYINTLNAIHVGKNATVDYSKITHASARTIRFTNTFIQQKQQSHVQLNHFVFNNAYSRDDVAIALQEPQAICETRGFYVTRQDHEFVDHQIFVDHQAPTCKSDMLYKGILQNKSRADFNGKVLVRPAAQKTEAHQANHHLLLSQHAAANAKPELEIYADDVRCKHGATVGELDKEALFYLCSRGISHEEATQLLLGGFAAEVLQRVTHPMTAEYVRNVALAGQL